MPDGEEARIYNERTGKELKAGVLLCVSGGHAAMVRKEEIKSSCRGMWKDIYLSEARGSGRGGHIKALVYGIWLGELVRLKIQNFIH